MGWTDPKLAVWAADQAMDEVRSRATDLAHTAESQLNSHRQTGNSRVVLTKRRHEWIVSVEDTGKHHGSAAIIAWGSDKQHEPDALRHALDIYKL